MTSFDDDDVSFSAGPLAEDRAHHSTSPKVDRPRIEAAVREILLAIGEDPDRGGLLDTPKRVAKAYAEVFAGLHHDPADVLSTT
ncbi:MAG: GTP cyclohydrolase I, partial [Actinomycetes bacterium]